MSSSFKKDLGSQYPHLHEKAIRKHAGLRHKLKYKDVGDMHFTSYDACLEVDDYGFFVECKTDRYAEFKHGKWKLKYGNMVFELVSVIGEEHIRPSWKIGEAIYLDTEEHDAVSHVVRDVISGKVKAKVGQIYRRMPSNHRMSYIFIGVNDDHPENNPMLVRAFFINTPEFARYYQSEWQKHSLIITHTEGNQGDWWYTISSLVKVSYMIQNAGGSIVEIPMSTV